MAATMDAARQETRDDAVTILREALESAEAITDLETEESRHKVMVAESGIEEAALRLRLLLEGWPVLPVWTLASKVRELREAGREHGLVVFDPKSYLYIGLAETEEAVPEGMATLQLKKPHRGLRELKEEGDLPVQQRTRLIEIELAREASKAEREVSN